MIENVQHHVIFKTLRLLVREQHKDLQIQQNILADRIMNLPNENQSAPSDHQINAPIDGIAEVHHHRNRSIKAVNQQRRNHKINEMTTTDRPDAGNRLPQDDKMNTTIDKIG